MMKIITKQQIEQFQAVDKEYRDVMGKREKLFEQLFPPGTIVYWLHHGHLQSGHVTRPIAFGNYLDLQVENDKTGKIVRITAYDISWEHMKTQEEVFNELVEGLDHEMRKMQ